MNWWSIIFILFLVVTLIGLVASILIDEDYGYVAVVSFILMWIEVGIYLWYRAIIFTIDRFNSKENTLDWVEVLGFITILGFIFGGSAKAGQ